MVAVHQGLVTAGCMKGKTHRCVCSDKPGCCHLAYRSAVLQGGMHRLLGMVAVHQGLVTAWVYEGQNS